MKAAPRVEAAPSPDAAAPSERERIFLVPLSAQEQVASVLLLQAESFSITLAPEGAYSSPVAEAAEP